MPIGNVLVSLHFFTKGNYRYGFQIGRTDDAGRISVSYDDVESLRRKDAQDNLMDYNTKLEDCDPSVAVVIPSQEELRQQYDNAMRFYKAPPEWATAWPENARLRAQERLFDMSASVTTIKIPVQLTS